MECCRKWVIDVATFIFTAVDADVIYKLTMFVLPIELRRNLGIEIRDPLEIYVDADTILLKKYAPACILCSESDDLVEYKSKKICRKCIEKMGK